MGSHFDRYNEGARRVLVRAQTEAGQYGRIAIGTEHLLLGLLAEENGLVRRALTQQGITLDKAKSAIAFIHSIGRDHLGIVDSGMTPQARRVIELAVDSSRRLDHNYIGPEHLLLGLLAEPAAIATGVLESFGVVREQLRASVLTELGTAEFTQPLPNEVTEDEESIRRRQKIRENQAEVLRTLRGRPKNTEPNSPSPASPTPVTNEDHQRLQELRERRPEIARQIVELQKERERVAEELRSLMLQLDLVEKDIGTLAKRVADSERDLHADNEDEQTGQTA